MKKKLEICCFTIESALNAQKGGADRIELCDNIFEGGTTPSFGMISLCRKLLSIDINVIIRPRGGDFLYSDDEFKIMKHDLLKAKTLGVNGIVSGVLTKNARIDIPRTKELIDLAYPLPVTFHRAFDMVKDPFNALEDIIKCGAKKVLSSGLKKTAEEGIDIIEELVSIAGNIISIMPGSGINETNLDKIVKLTGAKEFHSSAKVIRPGKMEFKNTELSMGPTDLDEYSNYIVDIEKVKKMKAILNTH